MGGVISASHIGYETQAIAHYRRMDGTAQVLSHHLFGTSAQTRFLADRLGLPLAGELIGLLHDLGKYHLDFQRYLASAAGRLNPDEDEDFVDPDGLRGKVDHSTAGAQLIWRELSGRGPVARALAQMLALCVASHHSGLIDCLGSIDEHLGEDVFAARMNKPEARAHADEAWLRADEPVRVRATALLNDPALIDEFVSCLRAIGGADGETVVRAQHGLVARLLFSCLIEADRLDTARFMHPASEVKKEAVAWEPLRLRLEEALARKEGAGEVNRLRRRVAEHCLDAAEQEAGRVLSLTVPTGGGKTLASLRFALRHAEKHSLERIFFILPFTAIIDQNADVVRRILDPEGCREVVLEHHSNLTPERQGWAEKLLAETWDAPVVFTTMVQVLETLFGAGTRGARRLNRLARSVVIFDEVQSLPVPCVHLFANAVNVLTKRCGSTVVLCTATQPLLHQVDPRRGAVRLAGDGKIIPEVGPLFQALRRVKVVDHRRDRGWSDEEIADLAQSEAARASSCLVVVNTKKSARRLHALCRDAVRVPTFHLSTGMCPAHRRAVLAEVSERLAKREPVLCVSTQLIEAGVDISFGAVVRFAAGLDSIAQAAGRCNRNGEAEIGVVHVVNSRDEILGAALREIAVAQENGARVLREFAADPAAFDDDPLGPRVMARFYQYYFHQRREEMRYAVAGARLGHADTVLDMLADNPKARQRGRGGEFFAQSFMAAGEVFKAIDAPTDGVVVPFGGDGRALVEFLRTCDDGERQAEAVRQVQPFTVSVFPGMLTRMKAAGLVHPIAGRVRVHVCDARAYHPEIGLTEDAFGEEEI